jgi:endoglucanase
MLTFFIAQVTQDYNSAFTGLNAAMIEFYGASKFQAFSDCGLDLGWSHPNATNPPQWPDNDCYHTCATNCASQASTNSTGGNGGSSAGNGSNGSSGSSGSTGGAATTGLSVGFTLFAVASGLFASLLL